MANGLVRRGRLITVATVLLVAVLAVWGGTRATNGLRQLEQAKTAAQGLEQRLDGLLTIAPGDTALLQSSISEVEGHLSRARRELGPFLPASSLLGWVPGIGPQLRSASDMLSLGSNLVHASQDLVSAVDLAASETAGSGAPLLDGNRFNETLLLSLASGEPLLVSATASLQQARATLERLDSRSLPTEYLNIVEIVRAILPDLEVLARTGLAASRSWGSFLGYDTPQTYMLVAQNADELRASGGFIPGAWLLTLDQGEITLLEFWDTVAVDDLSAGPPLPPEGLLQSLWGGAWLFRDAGWYPDFPTSARVMEQMFKLGQGTSVDGVIALDQWAVQGILEAIGPATLPTGETLDASTYLRLLEEKTDALGRGFVDTVMGALLDAIREQRRDQDTFYALLAALNKSLVEKHILTYFHDETLRGVAQSNGWDGAQNHQPGDYLMAVDSNVGFSKINRNITRQFEYTVDLSTEGEATARLDILYSNLSTGGTGDSCDVQSTPVIGLTYEQQKNTCYWNYLRIYSPEGSALASSSPFPMPEGALYRSIGYNDIEDTLRTYTENEKAVFAGFFNLEEGESRKVAFAYDLPSQVVERVGKQLTYDLFLQKQPGTQSTPVAVTVKTPEGFCLQQATPKPTSWDAKKVEFSANLDADTPVQLVLRRTDICQRPSQTPTAQGDPFPADSAKTAFASLVVGPSTGAGKVDYLDVSPKDAALVPAQRFLFTALALDTNRRPVSNVSFQWRVTNPLVGTVTPSGLFTAGPSPGIYQDAVEVSAVSFDGTVTTTANVTIVTQIQGQTRLLDSVVVYPSEISVRPGQVVGLGALGWDNKGRFVQNLSFRWSMNRPEAGSVVQAGFFAAGAEPGRYPNAVRVVATQDTPDGTVKREAFVSVVVGEANLRGVLSRLVVVPNAVTLTFDQQINFIARALDESGQAVRGVTYRWEVIQPAAGHLKTLGQFVAGKQAGSYPGAIRVVATQDPAQAHPLLPGSTLPVAANTLPLLDEPLEVTVEISVTVDAPAAVSPLAAARVIPGAVTLEPDDRWVFTAYGLNEGGFVVPAKASWEMVDESAGSISPLGFFTAGSEPGIYTGAVRVELTAPDTEGGPVFEAFATVNILGPLERVAIAPTIVTLEAGQSLRLVAIGYDANGLEIPSLRLRWSVEDSEAGEIDQTGIFTAGSDPGEYPNAVKVMAAPVDRR